MRIYKSSNIRIVGIINLVIIVSTLGLGCLSSPGSLKEKNDYDLFSPQKALASYIDICKKADKDAYIDVMSKERLRELESWIREVKMEPGKFHRIENYSILKEDQIDDFAAIYTKVKYTSDEWAGLGAYVSFLFIKEDDQWKLLREVSSDKEMNPDKFLPHPPGTFKNTELEWEKIPVLLSVPPESNLPFEKVKVTFDNLYIYLHFEYKNKVIPQGGIVGSLAEGEFPEHNSFSIRFDIDNNPETPKFIKGFEREIVFYFGEAMKGESKDGKVKRWRLRNYSYQIKEYAEGKLGELIFSARALPMYRHIVIEDKSITLRVPKKYIPMKRGSEVRIGFRYKLGKVITSKIVIP